MVTIMDVAHAANVSRSTVSLVINDSPLVKAETREHVKRVIARMRYVPNNNARGLSRKVMNTLGVIVMQEATPRDGYDFDQHTGLCSYNIGTGIMDGLSDTDYGVITEYFCSVANPGELPVAVQKHRVDGAFIVGAPYSDSLFAEMQGAGIPFVAVGVNSCISGVDSVFSDPGEGARMGVEHLLDTGHKNICYINGPSHLSSYVARCQAIRLLEGEGRLRFNWDWMLSCPLNHGASSFDTFRAFWQAGNRPDGIVTANAQLALGAMRYLYGQGVRLPQDISFVAYEDSALAGYAVPPLTTVNIQKELMGRQAARCLLERLETPDKPVERMLIPSFLTLRGSVMDRRG